LKKRVVGLDIKNKRNSLAHGDKRRLDSRQQFEETVIRLKESLLRVAAPDGTDVGFLISNKKSGKCLDVPWDMSNYTVHQYDCHKEVNQQWVLRKVEGGLFVIISRYTGRCLDVSHHLSFSRLKKLGV
jgi:Ricin-type beta-trefoil lectin domain-like